MNASRLDDAAILVTGGTGFLGRQVTAQLANQGATVMTVARAERSPELDGPWLSADLRSASEARRCVRELRALQCTRHAIVHLAGMSDAAACEDEPLRAFEHNVVTTANLLDSARDQGISHFTLASTCYVYGDQWDQPFIESDHLAPASVYASTKCQAEDVVRTYSAYYGVRSDILRLSTLYGAGASRASALGLALAQARHEARIRLRDGSPIRDFLYVVDAAEVVANLIGDPADESCRTLNVGSGEPVSVAEACQTLGRVAGLHVDRVSFSQSPGSTRLLTLDISSLRRECPSFRPVSLQAGLHESFTRTS